MRRMMHKCAQIAAPFLPSGAVAGAPGLSRVGGSLVKSAELVDPDDVVGEAGEEVLADGVPGDGHALVVLDDDLLLDPLVLHLGLLALQLHHDVVLADVLLLGRDFEQLDAEVGGHGDEVLGGVEGQLVDGGVGSELVFGLLGVAEVPDVDLLVLASGGDELAEGGHRQVVDVGLVGLERVLELQVHYVPDLESAVPAHRREVVARAALRGALAQQPHARHPVLVVLHGLALPPLLPLYVPQPHRPVGPAGQDPRVVGPEGDREHLHVVALEDLGGSAGDVPEPEGLVPGGRDEVAVLGGERQVTDEVRVAGELLHGLARDGVLFEVKVPHDDAGVSAARDQQVAGLVGLERVARGQAGHPPLVPQQLGLGHQSEALVFVSSAHDYFNTFNNRSGLLICWPKPYWAAGWPSSSSTPPSLPSPRRSSGDKSKRPTPSKMLRPSCSASGPSTARPVKPTLLPRLSGNSSTNITSRPSGSSRTTALEAPTLPCQAAIRFLLRRGSPSWGRRSEQGN